MPEAVGPYCTPRSELSRCYLATYSKGEAGKVALNQFLDETTLLWASSALGDLKRCWLAAQKRPGPGGEPLLEKLGILVAAQPQVEALLP